MAGKDPLSVLRAMYCIDREETAWMRGIVEAARPYDLGLGIGGYVTELGVEIGFRALYSEIERVKVPALDAAVRTLPTGFWRRCHLPGPAALNVDALRAAAAAEGMPPEALPPEAFSSLIWGAIGGDPEVECANLCFACRDREALRAEDRVVLDGFAAHFGAALRLRARIGKRPAPDDVTTEAVLSPEGRVLDARGSAAKRALPTLSEGAKRQERARSRKADAQERVALWTALLDGRWSVVESIERDGKRMLLACRNEPRTARMHRLSARERSVLQYEALGHSHKYVSYELGLSVPAVVAALRSALRKLGLKSRRELLRTFGGLPPGGPR